MDTEESTPTQPDEDRRRECHAALDLMEAYFKQLARTKGSQLDPPDPIDLVVHLRRRVTGDTADGPRAAF